MHGGRCPCSAGRAGFPRCHDPCRDAGAHPQGPACSADHRDFAAVRARWSMFLLSWSCRFSGVVRRQLRSHSCSVENIVRTNLLHMIFLFRSGVHRGCIVPASCILAGLPMVGDAHVWHPHFNFGRQRPVIDLIVPS